MLKLILNLSMLIQFYNCLEHDQPHDFIESTLTFAHNTVTFFNNLFKNIVRGMVALILSPLQIVGTMIEGVIIGMFELFVRTSGVFSKTLKNLFVRFENEERELANCLKVVEFEPIVGLVNDFSRCITRETDVVSIILHNGIEGLNNTYGIARKTLTLPHCSNVSCFFSYTWAIIKDVFNIIMNIIPVVARLIYGFESAPIDLGICFLHTPVSSPLKVLGLFGFNIFKCFI